MKPDSPPSVGRCLLLSAAFALAALAVNYVGGRVLRFDVLGPSAKSFLLVQAPGLVLSTASFLLFLFGRRGGGGGAPRTVVTVLAALLGLYVIAFAVVIPSPWANLAALYVLAVVAVDCWACLLAMTAVDQLRKWTRHVGDA